MLTTAYNQSTIDFGNTSEAQSTEFENLREKFIIHCDLPLLLVESQLFRNLVRNLNIRIHFLSQQSIKNGIMNDYPDTKSVIKQQLSNVLSKISLASDIRTTDTMQPYFAITYHFVVPDGSLPRKLQDFIHSPGSYTGENIVHAFQGLLNDSSVLSENIIAISMDSATNNTSCYRLLLNHLDYGQIHEIRCFSPILSLACKSALQIIDEKNEALWDLVTKKKQRISTSPWKSCAGL